ncbi:uncharacterized protein LOC125455003 isoform X2 [Stegostoma tigrinum]|uniref:uncharacterized protein LOC125455003 isoform X2 n=1 Tax=Stegostoma tigrinum TaxID=3053191 RepID=UPI00202B82B0|nr:uncharacterized protein LOC125455003 isoform X2 [Stegostoma tigrinum]
MLAGIMSESMRKGIITLIYKWKGHREEIRNWRPISLLIADYNILSNVITNVTLFGCCTEPFAESFRKDTSLRGMTIPGSGGQQVKASLYMDDVAIFCSDLLSVCSLMRICDQFELTSGSKVNRGKSKAMFFTDWADRFFILFTVKTEFLKELGTWFRGTGACAKSWKEHIAKVKQKLVLLDQQADGINLEWHHGHHRHGRLKGLFLCCTVLPLPLHCSSTLY